MPNICYVPRKFKGSSETLIDQANKIIDEYTKQGFDLTLRQLYYQFISRDIFPKERTWKWVGSRWVRDLNGTRNATPNYKWLASVINDARLAGLIDWRTIVDRTRELKERPSWHSPRGILRACAAQFQLNKWEDQNYRPEVWIEKDALLGVIKGVCNELQVPYFSCRGYTSQSEMWSAAQRLIEYARKGQTPYIIHLGDHDPSGIDMSRDIRDRLRLFMEHHKVVVTDFKRLALNMDQVEEYDPPPNPTKITDSRAKGYIAEHGHESWELDALEPQVMADLIRDAIESVREDDLWEEKVEEEEKDKRALSFAANRWERIKRIYETDDWECESEDDEDEES